MVNKKSVKKKAWICTAMMAVLLVADQLMKLWIKTHLVIGGEIPLIGHWCNLHFIENEGIAFGISFGGEAGKYILTLFRIVAAAVIMYFIVKYIRKDYRYLLVVSLSLIFVGAIGNVVDSCFYGLIFSESTHFDVATLFPAGGGYGRFLLGKVVDMFYFPICEWTWPGWVPFVGGEDAEFFNAIFNVADAAICVGVALLVVDQFVFNSKDDEKADEDGTDFVENDGGKSQKLVG